MRNVLGDRTLDGYIGYIREAPKFLVFTDPFWDLFDTIFQEVAT